jgi:hypothetical protein
VLSWRPQARQCERGVTIDSPRGSRSATRLMKLPSINPTRARYQVKNGPINGSRLQKGKAPSTGAPPSLANQASRQIGTQPRIAVPALSEPIPVILPNESHL